MSRVKVRLKRINANKKESFTTHHEQRVGPAFPGKLLKYRLLDLRAGMTSMAKQVRRSQL